MKCSSRRRVTAALLLSFLTAVSTAAKPQEPLQPLQQSILPSDEHTFTLRHIFHRGGYLYPDLHKRLDIKPNHEFMVAYGDEMAEDAMPPQLKARSSPLEIDRLVDRRHESISDHLEYASTMGTPRVLDPEHWTRDEIPGPDVEDKDTVINLAIMAANAYVPKLHEGEWEDVGLGFNHSLKFGWEGEGLRGHIFADEKNETIVIALKGTSVAVFDGEGTTTGDKVNDNLFFSCCCGQGGSWLWKQACDCQTETYTCNNTCLTRALFRKTRYYTTALELFTNVTSLYPDSNYWITGHSLGGSLSSMIGLTYGIPAVTYEAPGDDLPARRLGLPIPGHVDKAHPFQRKLTGAKHFGHTADPVYMGSCNGALSLCSLGGYAMESVCHTGSRCEYDTVKDFGWSVSLLNHKIHTVIDDVLRKYKTVPKCEPDAHCIDCGSWKYFESNNSKTTTSASRPTSTLTMTRTEICKNPGWWGCLDPTSTPVTTTTLTTTTCVDPGWFGCNSDVTLTITTTTAVPTQLPTSTCETPGFFYGCWDDPKNQTRKHESTASMPGTMSFAPPMTTTHMPTKTESSTCIKTCHAPGFFWGCWDKPTSRCMSGPSVTRAPSIIPPTKTATPTSTTTVPRPHPPKRCKNPGMFWGCWDKPEHRKPEHRKPEHRKPEHKKHKPEHNKHEPEHKNHRHAATARPV